LILWKGEALGNDYLVVERSDLPWSLSPARCAAICDRHTGLGSDGILIRQPTAPGEFRLQILNPDGSEAEKSGNGLRIFGAYLHGLGLVANDWFTVRLVKDSVRMRVEGKVHARPVAADAGKARSPAVSPEVGGARIEHDRDWGALDIRVEMGRASFRCADAGFQAPDVADNTEVLGHKLALPKGGHAEINTVSLSNPHCVVLVDALDRDDFLARAPQLCTHHAFSRGTNVQFARVMSDNLLEILIWERGVGETLASGSSACAAAAAAVRRGDIPFGRTHVRMSGGTAEVEILEDYAVRLRGPARMIYRAEILATTLAGWGELA
jgi:diaminopimelate epimerase